MKITLNVLQYYKEGIDQDSKSRSPAVFEYFVVSMKTVITEDYDYIGY
jgi:hypothetical protein